MAIYWSLLYYLSDIYEPQL